MVLPFPADVISALGRWVSPGSPRQTEGQSHCHQSSLRLTPCFCLHRLHSLLSTYRLPKANRDLVGQARVSLRLLLFRVEHPCRLPLRTVLFVDLRSTDVRLASKQVGPQGSKGEKVDPVGPNEAAGAGERPRGARLAGRLATVAGSRQRGSPGSLYPSRSSASSTNSCIAPALDQPVDPQRRESVHHRPAAQRQAFELLRTLRGRGVPCA